jgi:medium-chain acyl-[acyl-carrier-protein] hydrolase
MSYFIRPRPLTNPSLRLIAFHHAGGSAAMYHPMSAWLPAGWELLILDLPGRGKRHAEAPIRAMPALLARVVDDVRPWLDAPVAFFGHSLGAILAAEVGRACQSLGTPPVWVGISGRVAASLQAEAPRLSEMDDASLLAELIALGGTPGRIHEMPELREHLLRIVRADIALLESYEPVPGREALGCPVTAFAGTADHWAPPATMRPWARETGGDFRLRLYPGGHFYFLGPAFTDFVRDIVREIEPHLEARTPPFKPCVPIVG